MKLSGVGTYTDTPDWSRQSFWKISLKTQSEIVDSIPLYQARRKELKVGGAIALEPAKGWGG